MGDGAEVFDEFVTGHAETVIRDGEGAFFFVGGEGDFQRQVGLEEVVLRELGMAELFESVSGVGNELADEDFAIRVEGVDDDVEDLFDFGLEFVFSGHNDVFWGGIDVIWRGLTGFGDGNFNDGSGAVKWAPNFKLPS